MTYAVDCVISPMKTRGNTMNKLLKAMSTMNKAFDSLSDSYTSIISKLQEADLIELQEELEIFKGRISFAIGTLEDAIKNNT